jgi:hypothetical protein
MIETHMSEKEMTKDEGMANSFAMEGGALRRQTNIPRSAQKRV